MNAPVLAKKQNSKSVVAIPPLMLENSMDHRYAGNGWAVVEAYPDDWVAAVYIGKATVGSQLFLCWNRLLSPEKLKENQGTIEQPRWVTTDRNKPIHHTLLSKLNEIRADLASGRKVIHNTRLVNAD